MDQVIYLVTFIGLFCSFALGEFSHFYYTTPYVYQPPLETGQGYEYSTDNTYFSRSFSPVSTFYYTQGSFAFAPQQYQQRSHTNGYGKERTEELNYKPPPTIQTRTRFVKGPLDEFRGFAYHTTYNDGASSNVVFVTGPEARQIQNPETEKNTNTGDFTLQPRKLISELTSNENIPQFLKIDDFFKNPVSSIQNFYSRNEKAFTENLQTGSNYPASTVPLQNAAVDINTGIALKSTENSTEKIISTSETTSTTDSTTEKEVETAESVVNSNQLAAFLLQTSSPPSLNDAANNTEAIDSSTTADKLPSAKSEENVNENSVTLSESTTQHTTESGTISETTSTDTIEKLRQQKCLKELQSLKNK